MWTSPTGSCCSSPPGGLQLSWHIAPADAGLFQHVEHVDPDDLRAQWDGHTTDEKYERIRGISFTALRGHHARQLAAHLAEQPTHVVRTALLLLGIALPPEALQAVGEQHSRHAYPPGTFGPHVRPEKPLPVHVLEARYATQPAPAPPAEAQRHVRSLDPEQLHQAIRELGRTDPVWLRDTIRAAARTEGSTP